MHNCFLKRVLPFALTLLVGVALGGFTNLFRSQRYAANEVPAVREYPLDYSSRGCSKRRSYYRPRGAGQLVSIQRQTDDGSWVMTRPVGPEIYELTTRPAIIRSRPDATYTDEARRSGVTGTVLLEATLSARGDVTDIKPRWAVEGLTVPATLAARQLDFSPALRDGRPVEQRILLEYRFDR